MSLPNYFAFYQLPISFFIDEKELKKRFFAFNRQFHPDYFTQSDPEEQNAMLEMATYNNKAYNTLLNFDQRIKYILEICRQMKEGEKYQLPGHFLAEMMSINEALMELQFEPDEAAINQIVTQLTQTENELLNKVTPLMKQFSETEQNNDILAAVKEFYYKKRYLLRIKETLSKFASA